MWEYTIHDSGVASSMQDVQTALNELGRDGWELCYIAQFVTAKWLVMKRPKK